MEDAHRDLSLPARFLRASFQVPEQQVALLARPRLCERLDEALTARLMLLIAPAGCGKSTALSQWAGTLRERNIVCAWLNVIRDAGPADLFLSIAWAFELSGVPLSSTGALSEFSDGAVDHQERLAILLAAVAQVETPVVLVFDEFERLRDPESLAVVSLLLTAAPRNLHVIVASRKRPELSVSSLHAQGLVRRVAVEELMFSPEEARSVLAPVLTAEDADLVVQRTEGWPVAVTLAKLWFRQGERHGARLAEFTGSLTEVSAYLAEQVVAALSDELREFLLDVAVLDQVTPAMADSIRGRSDSMRHVHALLELSPAVVVLDRSGPVVRLHPLLNEYLLERLRSRDPDRLVRLHEAAARTYAHSGRLLESIQHTSAASNAPLACELLLAQSPMRICVMHGSATVSACLRALPESEWRRHPRLRLCEAFILIRRGEHLRAEIAFRELESDTTDRSLAYLSESFVVAVMLAFRCPHLSQQKLRELESTYRSFGCVDTWAEFCIETLALVVNLRAGRLYAALRSIEFQRAVFAGVKLTGSGLHIEMHRGHVQLARGELSACEATFRKVLRVARSVVGPEKSVNAIARCFLHWVQYETDRDELTETDAQNLLTDLERTDAWFDHYVGAYLVAIELAYRNEGLPSASRIISRGRIAATRQMLGQSFERLLSTLEADLLVRESMFDCAAHWLEHGADAVAAESTYYEKDLLVRAQVRFLLARHEFARALTLANSWADRCVAEGRKSALCRARLMSAAAALGSRLLDESQSHFLQALAWAGTESAVAPFLECRAETQQLLETIALSRALLPAETRGFVDALRDRIGQSAQARKLYTLLTRRESEILTLLRDNPSNKHVARVARITEDAVKFHLKNIYRKLGVHTREEALRALDEAVESQERVTHRRISR